MNKQFLRFTLYAIIIYVTNNTSNPAIAASQPLWGDGAHICAVIDEDSDKRHSDQFLNHHYAHAFAANLNFGDPRTVRLIYFLPNDRPYRAAVVQRMKDRIRTIQTFFAEQMAAHGYGKITFRVETDPQGKPIVHRVNGRHPDRYYLSDTVPTVYNEIAEAFNFFENIYFIVVDNSTNRIGRGTRSFGGFADRKGKNGGYVLIRSDFGQVLGVHEMGHAFGLMHDFSNTGYIMSYGPGRNQLSADYAEYLSVHPYFNPDIPIQENHPPNIELISLRQYPAGSENIPIRLNVSDSDGIHQVILFVTTIEPHPAAGQFEIKESRSLGGDTDPLVRFGYDGVFPSNRSTNLSNPMAHPIRIEAVDRNGNVNRNRFVLFSEALQPLTKILGDNQHSLPNTPLPVPFVIEVRNVRDGSTARGVDVTFTPTAGGGRLSTVRTTTNAKGRAQSTLTLGPSLGTHTVQVSAAGIEGTVTFNAVAEPAIDIPDPNLRAALETRIGVSPGDPISPSQMTTLTHFTARNADISDLTGLESATNLRDLKLPENGIADMSALSGLTNLTVLNLGNNSISDLSPLVGLTDLTELLLGNNNISDISALAGLTNLMRLHLENNNISDISAVAGLTNLTQLSLKGNSISDISRLVENTGLGSGDTVDLRGNLLGYQSIYTHIPALQSRQVTVEFDNRTPTPPLKISGDDQRDIAGTALEQPLVVEVRDGASTPFEGVPVIFTITAGGGSVQPDTVSTNENGRAQTILTLGLDGVINTVAVNVEGVSETVTFSTIANIQFDLSLPSGLSLTHVPLKVIIVDGTPQPIESIANLYDALGGADTVINLFAHDARAREWVGYFRSSDRGTAADRALTDDMGVIAHLATPVSIRLSGSSLGTNGTSLITLNPGLNLVGLPLEDSRVTRVSDLFALEGIEDNVSVIYVEENGAFKAVTQADDPGDILITGGQSFILVAQNDATVAISGDGWTNISQTAAAPSVRNTNPRPILTGIQVTDTTPILGLNGSIVNEETGVKMAGFRVTVKNLSTGREVSTIVTDGLGYRLAVVDIETGRAAAIGDILEVSAQASDPLIGVAPLRYTVTTKDLNQSFVQLPALVTYEIPTETELLTNYPNPFNPETWIPYRLAEDAFVTLTIYDPSGHVVRTLNLGHRVAAVYESQSKAIHWNGRNDAGEGVASGVYFYTLTAGDYSATRKMLILK